MRKVYLDENLSHFIAEALNLVNKAYYDNILILSTKKEIKEGIKDEELIPIIGKQNGVLITKDINIKRKKHQFKLCADHNVSVVFLKFESDHCRNMDIFEVLVKNWVKIMDAVSKEKSTFILEVTSRSIKKNSKAI